MAEDFVIRGQQAAVAMELIEASGNQLLQLNMGEGKPLVMAWPGQFLTHKKKDAESSAFD